MTEPVVNTPQEVDPALAVLCHMAYHEAGHALADVCFGHHILWAALPPAQGLTRGGRVVSQGPAALTSRQAIVENAASYCAGLIAETLSPHQELRDQFDRSDDLLAVQEMMITCFPNDAEARERLWQEAHECAARLLEKPEQVEAVRSIAAALVRQRQLSHEEVVTLMKEAREHVEAEEHRKWSQVWRWFWWGAVLAFVVTSGAFFALVSFVNVGLLLVLKMAADFLTPLVAWKMAQRRYGVADSDKEAKRKAPQSRAWSFTDYGAAPLERLGVARSIKQKQEQKQAKKPTRTLYDRHRRLPQHRRET